MGCSRAIAEFPFRTGSNPIVESDSKEPNVRFLNAEEAVMVEGMMEIRSELCVYSDSFQFVTQNFPLRRLAARIQVCNES